MFPLRFGRKTKLWRAQNVETLASACASILFLTHSLTHSLSISHFISLIIIIVTSETLKPTGGSKRKPGFH